MMKEYMVLASILFLIAGCSTSVIVRCEDESCFKEKFTNCESAIFLAKVGEALVYEYRIIGPKDGLCEVESQFLSNINPEFVGKRMVCFYDSQKDFETQIREMRNCKGALYDLMITSQGKESQKNESTPQNNCESMRDCRARDEICFEKICVRITDSLKEEILNKYSQPPCGEPCEACSDATFFGGKTYAAHIGKNDFQIAICKECDIDANCVEGYRCEPYKCVPK